MFLRLYGLFPPKISVDLFPIVQVCLAEGFDEEIFLHVDDLEVEHQSGKDRRGEKHPVKEHQHDPEIYQIEPKKGGVPADLIDPAGDQLSPVGFRYAGPPAGPHGQDGAEEDGNAKKA